MDKKTIVLIKDLLLFKEKSITDRKVHIVKNGNNVYICRLIETGILAQWFDEPSRKDLVFKLLSSVRHELTNEEIQFMAERSFVSEEDDCRTFAKTGSYGSDDW